MPGCRRTRIDPGDGLHWICGRHWQPVDKQYRAVYARAKREAAEAAAIFKGFPTLGYSADKERAWAFAVRLRRRETRLWRRVQRQAIERAMGVG